MHTEQAYKGAVLEAVPYELQERPGWAVRLIIRRYEGDSTTAQFIQVRGSFVTQATAVASALEVGREFVDKLG